MCESIYQSTRIKENDEVIKASRDVNASASVWVHSGSGIRSNLVYILGPGPESDGPGPNSWPKSATKKDNFFNI